MVMIRLACALAVFVTCFTIQTYPQDKTKYPSREEINRVLPQAEAATIQYRHSLDQQQIKLGKSADEAVARDRKTLADLEMLLQAIKGNPDGFNGPAGFFVYETLGEIQKNALVCTISAMSKNAILFAVTGSGDKDLENLGK